MALFVDRVKARLLVNEERVCRAAQHAKLTGDCVPHFRAAGVVDRMCFPESYNATAVNTTCVCMPVITTCLRISREILNS